MRLKFNYIQSYTDFFHDGTIHEIEYLKNEIVIYLESAELLPEWNKDNILLSKRNTISGKLHLQNPGCIKINSENFCEKLIKKHDSSDVYTFEIKKNKVLLTISWINYPPKPRESTPFADYELEAEKIYWENIPSLFDEH